MDLFIPGCLDQLNLQTSHITLSHIKGNVKYANMFP